MMPDPLQDIFGRQPAGFRSDRGKTRDWRLGRLDRRLLDHQDRCCVVLHTDFGRPPFERLLEVAVPIGNINHDRDNPGGLGCGGAGRSGMGKYCDKAGFDAPRNARSRPILSADRTIDAPCGQGSGRDAGAIGTGGAHGDAD